MSSFRSQHQYPSSSEQLDESDYPPDEFDEKEKSPIVQTQIKGKCAIIEEPKTIELKDAESQTDPIIIIDANDSKFGRLYDLLRM